MFQALTCPQCGGTLPRQALWRHVACPFCQAMVTRSTQAVQRQTFREAHQRALAEAREAGPVLSVGGRPFRLLSRLGEGERCEVWLAEGGGMVRERITLKRAHQATTSLADEAERLRRLQALQADGSEYFNQRLPQIVAHGRIGGDATACDAIALRHPTGFDLTLADFLQRRPAGLRNARHAVWLWRRVLELLSYLHGAGWTHGDLRPEHWLVHPADHGVLLLGWAHARESGRDAGLNARAHVSAVGRDLAQSAWALRAVLQGAASLAGDATPAIPSHVPPPLAALLRRASEDSAWCASVGALALNQAVSQAAREAFGPPQFVRFDPATA